MAYIGPNFQIVNSENLTIGFLRDSGADKLLGYAEVELLGGGETSIKKINFNLEYNTRLPLCSAGDNKFWILTDEGKIEKKYLR